MLCLVASKQRSKNPNADKLYLGPKEQSYQWDLQDQWEFQPHTVYNLGPNKTITVSMISAIKAIIKGNVRGSKYKEPQPAGSESKV